MKKERFELLTYMKSAREVLKNKGAFLEGKTPRVVRIENRDEEDTFVNVSCNDNLIVVCRCLRPEDNSEDFCFPCAGISCVTCYSSSQFHKAACKATFTYMFHLPVKEGKKEDRVRLLVELENNVLFSTENLSLFLRRVKRFINN